MYYIKKCLPCFKTKPYQLDRHNKIIRNVESILINQKNVSKDQLRQMKKINNEILVNVYHAILDYNINPVEYSKIIMSTLLQITELDINGQLPKHTVDENSLKLESLIKRYLNNVNDVVNNLNTIKKQNHLQKLKDYTLTKTVDAINVKVKNANVQFGLDEIKELLASQINEQTDLSKDGLMSILPNIIKLIDSVTELYLYNPENYGLNDVIIYSDSINSQIAIVENHAYNIQDIDKKLDYYAQTSAFFNKSLKSFLNTFDISNKSKVSVDKYNQFMIVTNKMLTNIQNHNDKTSYYIGQSYNAKHEEISLHILDMKYEMVQIRARMEAKMDNMKYTEYKEAVQQAVLDVDNNHVYPDNSTYDAKGLKEFTV